MCWQWGGGSRGTKKTSHLSLVYPNYESQLPRGAVEVGWRDPGSGNLAAGAELEWPLRL